LASVSPQAWRSFHRAEKFFAAGGALGVAAALSARKTRESVPVIRSDDAASGAFDGRQGPFGAVANEFEARVADR
jgi:hypothetical protein